jgi:hypothetical protein
MALTVGRAESFREAGLKAATEKVKAHWLRVRTRTENFRPKKNARWANALLW